MGVFEGIGGLDAEFGNRAKMGAAVGLVLTEDGDEDVVEELFTIR